MNGLLEPHFWGGIILEEDRLTRQRKNKNSRVGSTHPWNTPLPTGSRDYFSWLAMGSRGVLNIFLEKKQNIWRFWVLPKYWFTVDNDNWSRSLSKITMMNVPLNEKWRYLYTRYKTNTTHMYFHWPGALPCFKKKSMYSFYYITTYRRKNHRIKEILKIPGGEHFNQTKSMENCSKMHLCTPNSAAMWLVQFQQNFQNPNLNFRLQNVFGKNNLVVGKFF